MTRASGHWFDPQSGEQYVQKIEHLQGRTLEYDRQIADNIQNIEGRLDKLAESDQNLAAETRRQLQETVDFVGRFKSQASQMLLELSLEAKQLHESVSKSIKEQSEFKQQELEIERGKLQVERWKVAVGIAAAFLTGLLFPVLLWLMGAAP